MGPVNTFPTYSLSDVVQHKLEPKTFKDKLVLIGPTATGIGDTPVVPFQQMGYPGVEVHANFIDNILYNHFIRPAFLRTSSISASSCFLAWAPDC